MRQVALRFLVPRVCVSLYYFVRYRARVSMRAEVEISPQLTFGRDCVVSSFTKIKATDGPVSIGKRCGFATGCYVSPGARGIYLGDNVIAGPNVVILGGNYVAESVDVPLQDQGWTSRGVRIGNNVWIGAGTTVLDGSVLGDNTIVVANSLVNRRFPPNVIVQGNPARIILKRGAAAQPSNQEE